MRGLAGSELLKLPIRLRGGIQLGQAVDLVLDLDGRRALGVEVLCGDDVRRFLPLAAARIEPSEIGVHSPLTLLDDPQVVFYRERATSLRALGGAPVERDGAEAGLFEDVILGGDGSLDEVVVEAADGRRRFAFAPSVSIRRSRQAR